MKNMSPARIQVQRFPPGPGPKRSGHEVVFNKQKYKLGINPHSSAYYPCTRMERKGERFGEEEGSFIFESSHYRWLSKKWVRQRESLIVLEIGTGLPRKEVFDKVEWHENSGIEGRKGCKFPLWA